MSWTDERISTLKTMWEAGQTASQIAEALGGVSRNAVIGKAHRLALQARPSPVKPNEPEKASTVAPRAAAAKARDPGARSGSGSACSRTRTRARGAAVACTGGYRGGRSRSASRDGWRSGGG